jgi:hypothetical protein
MAKRPAHQNRRAKRKRKRQDRKALDHAVRIIRFICQIAGSPSLVEDLWKVDEPGSLGAAIENLDTPTLYDHLI